MYYIANLIIIFIYYLLIVAIFGRRTKARTLFFFIASLHIIAFRALANPYIYTDTEGYAFAYEKISSMGFKEAVLFSNYVDWGQCYVALNWLISRFSPDPLYMFVIISSLSVGGVLLFYYKTSITPLSTIFLYLTYPMMYIMGFGVIRQHLAVMFVLWAVYFISNLKVSIPFFIAGFLCHSSAIIIVPFYFIRYIEIRKINIIKLILYTLVFIGSAFIVTPLIVSKFTRYEDVLTYEGYQSNIVPVIAMGSLFFVYVINNTFYKTISDKDNQINRYFFLGLIISLFCTTIPS